MKKTNRYSNSVTENWQFLTVTLITAVKKKFFIAATKKPNTNENIHSSPR